MRLCYKRIILDIKDIEKDPIDNIYYVPNEDNILNGYALIIGPENTPYQYGYYFFEFKFTEDYPNSPPIVKYLSNDGITRFNPNFYISGKVCLSILNTWSGEKWSACQSLRSVLLTLQTRLNEYPMLNEPGLDLSKHNVIVKEYNTVISYKNLEFCIYHYIKNKKNVPISSNSEIQNKMYDIIIQKFKENKDKIMNSILIQKTLEPEPKNKCFNFFGSMRIRIDYETLYERLKLIYKKLK
jgi:ubiquitin-conjugating enzyme E2 Z